MNIVILEYDRQRPELLCYVKEKDDVYILSTLCVYMGDFKPVSVFRGELDLWDADPYNPIFWNPISDRRHSVLYSNGKDVMDGYGMSFEQLYFDNGVLSTGDTHTHVYFRPHTEYENWSDNVKNSNPSNVFGPIPNRIDKISDATDIMACISYTGLDFDEIVKIYKDSEQIKRTIRHNIRLLQSS